MRNKFVLYILCILFAFFQSCSKTEKFDVKILTEDGVKIVSNPSYPRDGIVVYFLEEDLSIGVEEGDDNYMFFRAADIQVDDDHNIYVLDAGNNRIQVYERNGKYLKTIGKKGQGPGEMENAFHISLAADGTIGIVDYGNMRVTLFNSDGSYLTDFKTKEGFASEMSLLTKKQIVLMQNTRSEEGERLSIFNLYDNKGNFLNKVAEFPGRQTKIMMRDGMAIGVPAPFSSATAWTIDKNGNIYIGYSSNYEISVYSYDGSLKYKIRRAYQPIEVTQEEKDETLSGLKARNIPEDLMKEITFPKYKPCFETYKGFLIDNEGNLMIRIPLVKKEDKIVIYDVFDSNGIYIHQAKIEQIPFLINDGYIYTFKSTEEGVQSVKRYKFKINMIK